MRSDKERSVYFVHIFVFLLQTDDALIGGLKLVAVLQ
jgi:hypothetical protein